MKNDNKGFTLVELLVVIAIIGLLSTIAVVSLGSARTKARDTKRLADTRQLMTALEQYYNDQNGYPTVAAPIALGSGSGQANACGTAHLCTCLSSTNAFYDACAGTTYMGVVPTDPAPPTLAACSGTYGTGNWAYNNNYCYYSSATSGTSTAYGITFKLENAQLGGTNCLTTNAGTSCS